MHFITNFLELHFLLHIRTDLTDLIDTSSLFISNSSFDKYCHREELSLRGRRGE